VLRAAAHLGVDTELFEPGPQCGEDPLEVLAALGAAFDLRYRTSIDLNRPVAGTLRGPVSTVISSLLKDYDYVVKSSSADRIEVIVIKLRERVSDKAMSAGASPYPPGLFQPRPPPGPSR
jgi:hypothetical protein